MPKHLPYRGDGFSTDFEPRRKFVNLRKLRWSLAKTIFVIVAIFSMVTLNVLRRPSNLYDNDKTYIAVLVIIWLVALIIIAGILNLNKFRKGRDVDISDQRAEKKDDGND